MQGDVAASTVWASLFGIWVKVGSVHRLETTQRRDAMEWLEDNWKRVSSEQEKITGRRSEGREFLKVKRKKLYQNWLWHGLK